MQVDGLLYADIAGRDDVRLLVDDEPNVADEAFIKDCVNGLPVVPARPRSAAQLGLPGWLVSRWSRGLP